MRSQSLTHLLFLDDNLFFADPILKNAKKFLDILCTYEKCSKQQINENKTTISFSKSTLKDGRKLIKDALGVSKIK